jgi:hypothetical protein
LTYIDIDAGTNIFEITYWLRKILVPSQTMKAMAETLGAPVPELNIPAATFRPHERRG